MLGFVPQAVSNRLVLQREANTLAGQSQPPPPPPKWPGMISSEQLSLELHQVEREIGKRTRELGMVSALVVVVLGGGEGCGVTPHTSHLTPHHLTPHGSGVLEPSRTAGSSPQGSSVGD